MGALAVPVLGGPFLVRPIPHRLYSWEKALRYFRDHRHAFDAVFVGSSLVKYNINNRVFDETLGGGFRSFSIGAPGYRGPAIYHLIDEVLKTGPESLRFLFVDSHCLFKPKTGVEYADPYFQRWHTAKRTLRELEHLARREGGLRARRDRVLRGLKTHGVSWLMNLYKVGAGIDMTVRLDPFSIETNFTPRDERFFQKHAGHFPFRSKPPAGRLADFRENPGAWPEYLDDYIAYNFEGLTPGLDSRAEDFERLVGRARAAGVEPVVVEWPSLAHRRVVEACLDAGLLRDPDRSGDAPALLSYADPREYPSLFLLDDRNRDINHLTEAATERFSRRLARDARPLIRA